MPKHVPKRLADNPELANPQGRVIVEGEHYLRINGRICYNSWVSRPDDPKLYQDCLEPGDRDAEIVYVHDVRGLPQHRSAYRVIYVLRVAGFDIPDPLLRDATVPELFSFPGEGDANA